MMSEPTEYVCASVMRCVAGRPVPTQLLEQGAQDSEWQVRLAVFFFLTSPHPNYRGIALQPIYKLGNWVYNAL